jgi:multidrug resistance efflux pump
MKAKRKTLITLILVLMVVAIAGIGVYYWYNNTYFASTDDAMVTADIAKANTQITGKLLELNVYEGMQVVKGQIIARQDMGSLPDTSVDMSVVRAPMTGLVIKRQGSVGEITPAAQPVALIIDPSSIYVNANIEETKIDRVKIGEVVEFTVDKFGSEKFTGKVQSVGQATAATFSLLPTSSGGTYTKVTQKIAVRIQLDKSSEKLEPGLNAYVKIHLK